MSVVHILPSPESKESQIKFKQFRNTCHKVCDYDHITGYYLVPAYRQCNIERPVKYLIPVFFHNFRKYDSHLIVHQCRYNKHRKINVIGQNILKYLQIQ
jgi:hypothetical protein